MGGLAEFGEHAKGGFRMEKSDQFIAGTFEGDFVDQTCALIFGVGELAEDIVGGEGEVMDSGTVFGEEFSNRTLVGCGFQKLDMDVTSSEKCSADFLGFYFFASFAGETEDIFVVLNRFVERVDGDSQVVDFCDHCGWRVVLGEARRIAGIGCHAPQGVANATRIF